jgi:hypothetical protein
MLRARWPPSFVVAGTESHAEEGGGLAPAWRNSVGQCFEPSVAGAPGTGPAYGSADTDPGPGCDRPVMPSVRLPRLIGDAVCQGARVAGREVG